MAQTACPLERVTLSLLMANIKGDALPRAIRHSSIGEQKGNEKTKFLTLHTKHLTVVKLTEGK